MRGARSLWFCFSPLVLATTRAVFRAVRCTSPAARRVLLRRLSGRDELAFGRSGDLPPLAMDVERADGRQSISRAKYGGLEHIPGRIPAFPSTFLSSSLSDRVINGKRCGKSA
jgi:hypothetical protein